MVGEYFLILAVLTVGAFILALRRARGLIGGRRRSFHSLPAYHGLLAASAVLVPMLVVYPIGVLATKWLATAGAMAVIPPEVVADELSYGKVLRDIENTAAGSATPVAGEGVRRAADIYGARQALGGWLTLGAGTGLAAVLALFVIGRIGPGFAARTYFERLVGWLLLGASAIAVLVTIGIVLSVVGETWRFFFDPSVEGKPTIAGFLFGLDWSPQAALRADQGEFGGAYGFVPLLVGTLLITLIALVVAGPIGLFSAIYLAEYASPRFRDWMKPILEVLAGIPTVVLGFFAALTVAPLIRDWGEALGLDVASESALAAGLVMGMMIIPFISSLSDDVIRAVPQSLREGSLGLGATRSETISRVVLPAALPGIVSAFMLATSRAIGETMIVVMAAGLAANLTINPLEAVTTITVQIKSILVGDQEFDSAKTLAAFALGFVLFFITLVLNFIALKVVQHYREQYD